MMEAFVEQREVILPGAARVESELPRKRGQPRIEQLRLTPYRIVVGLVDVNRIDINPEAAQCKGDLPIPRAVLDDLAPPACNPETFMIWPSAMK